MTKTRKTIVVAIVVAIAAIAGVAVNARAAAITREQRAAEVEAAANLLEARKRAAEEAAGKVIKSDAPKVEQKLTLIRRLPPVSYWDRVAQCETRSNWKDGGKWGGGLGIYVGTWRRYGGHQFAKHPSKATKEEQIIVANRIAVFGYQTKNTFMNLEDKQAGRAWFQKPVGYNGWGCIKNTVGKPFKKEHPVEGVKVRKVPQRAEFCRDYRKALLRAGFHPRAVKKAMWVMWRESRCVPEAYNAEDSNGGSYGLFQINGIWIDYLTDAGIIEQASDLYDPATNILAAVEIWRHGKDRYGYGWAAWNA